jgi:thiol-disulfide isomerase/thioredoxin
MAYYSRALVAIAAASLLAGRESNFANALDLTEENFSEMTSGKTVFLKMYAPWCGHCKSMAGDWAKLEADFEGHAVALVGSVDCTADESESICQDFQVQVRAFCYDLFCVVLDKILLFLLFGFCLLGICNGVRCCLEIFAVID